MRPYTSCKVTVHNILYGCINTSATEYGIQTEQQARMQLQMEIKKKLINVVYSSTKIFHFWQQLQVRLFII